MPRKPQGFGKRGRPTAKEIKQLKDARALIDASSVPEAYQMRHPNSAPNSTKVNCYRMVTEETIQKVKELLQLDKLGDTSKELLEKVLQFVIARWMNGNESTRDMLTAVALLAKLVPDFKDRSVLEDLSKKKPEELDEELERLGIKIKKTES